MYNDDFDFNDDDISDKIEDDTVRRRKKKKKKSTNIRWAVALLVELIIIAFLGVGIVKTYVHSKYQKFEHVKDIKKEDLEINEGADKSMDD